jgi:serine/threonine protein phosphatase PrpC
MQLTVANAGDSRIVLCRQGKAVALSEDHKPELPRETARIEAAGGFVEEEALGAGGKGYRVNGNLNLSRALGDLRYKDAASPPEKHMVSGVPDTKTITWQHGVDDFVIMACDGVWEVLNDQQVVNFVRARLPHPGTRRGLVPVLEALLDHCCASHPMQRGGLGCDNMTAVIVRFEDPEAVAAVGEEAEADEVAEESVSKEQTRQLEEQTRQLIQRLSDRRFRKKETPEERAERETREREERDEHEAREKEAIEQREIRRKRKEARELLESKSKKRLRCCAAVESDDDGSGDE